MEVVAVALLLLSTLWLFQIRKISDAVGIIAFQSFVLALIAGLGWYKTGIGHLLVACLLTLAIKTVIIPAILYHTIRKIGIKREVERVTKAYTGMVLAIILSVIGYYMASRWQLPGPDYGPSYLPAAVILVLLGTFIIIDHKKAIMQGIGLITIENGLFLLTQSVSYGMPLLVEFGVFFDLLVLVVVIGMLLLRIQSVFDSINTEKMQNLRG